MYNLVTVSDNPRVVRSMLSADLELLVWFDNTHYLLSAPSRLENTVANKSGGYFTVSGTRSGGCVHVRINPCVPYPKDAHYSIEDVIDAIVKSLSPIESGRRSH